MNPFRNFYYRSYQSVLYFASYFLNFREPRVISGSKSSGKVFGILVEKNIKRVLVITDQSIFQLGLLKRMLDGFEEADIKYVIYKDVVPNPTIKNIEEALALYKKENAKAIVAFGGGSSIDTAKGLAARVANPRKSIEKMRGILKVGGRIPLLIAIPTTAGTGSEATVAAVVVNDETRHKYAINAPKLIPHYAVLDPELLVGLPKHITSTTGMDSLTHAVEAFIGRGNTKKTACCAISAIQLIDKSLLESYNNPTNLGARKDMQLAAFQAGLAFTRAYVGYVHALAHALGGKYNVPHGLANAILLPYVLEAFGDKIYKRLAVLSDALKLNDEHAGVEAKALAFIAYIKDLNKKMAIPDQFVGVYNEQDIAELAHHAVKEANPLYPVPVIMDEEQLSAIYRKALGK
ncbi:MAG: iron-containing alcohol dehydrogenase [Bacteroidia bacterium]|nr:iron-containing alcohol dehydrogenase [Bacteroidia bacterium]